MSAAATEFTLPPERYDAMINWPRRLGNESPFFRKLFAGHQVRRVLDAACGTGHHAATFRAWGFDVTGADASEAMLAYARQVHGEHTDLQWRQRSFLEPYAEQAEFDATICIGNSLANLPDAAALQGALRNLTETVRPDGVLMVHFMNFWRLEEGPVLWQKCERFEEEGVPHVLLKGVHRCGALGYITTVDVALAATGVTRRERSSKLRSPRGAELLEAAVQAGLQDVELYGDYQWSPYDDATSADCILVATRAG